MRRYDDPVDVRRGMMAGAEGPEQFLWRGRLWKVHAVLAHWVETGAWWESPAPDRDHDGTQGATGPETGPQVGAVAMVTDLTAEREVWRVEASRGRMSVEQGPGVFDLLFDWADGSWRLARCAD